MEFFIGLLLVALFIGLIVRKKGDNTMDTLSKGLFWLFMLVLAFVLYYMWYLNNPEVL
tara:strand:- start:121 stop:294 length:174 start_codon:yes stop_codon:yes gene_type:complete